LATSFAASAVRNFRKCKYLSKTWRFVGCTPSGNFTAGKGGATVQNFDDFFTLSGLHSCSAATQVCFNKQDVTFKWKIIEIPKHKISAKKQKS